MKIYAERDRLEQRLSPDEETAVIDATRELLSDAAESIRRLRPEPSSPDNPALPGPREPLRVLGLATNGIADELALEMLGHLLDDLPIVVEITKGRMLAAEVVSLVQAQGVSVVCLADLPPSPPSKTRYLVKRLHAALPEVRILVGALEPAGAGGRQYAAAAGCGRDSRGLDAGRDPDVPGRPRRHSACPASEGQHRPGRLGMRTVSNRRTAKRASFGTARGARHHAVGRTEGLIDLLVTDVVMPRMMAHPAVSRAGSVELRPSPLE